MGLAFGLALLLVFLVLAAQFESWIHPAVIMLTVPLAALGGLFGLLMAGSTINTYSQIGLIILVGIAAKNGILIVEFANQLRDEGLSIREAMIESAVAAPAADHHDLDRRRRRRPAADRLGRGRAAGSRKTIGVIIFSGAIFATLLTLFVVPVFYNLLARFTKSPHGHGPADRGLRGSREGRASPTPPNRRGPSLRKRPSPSPGKAEGCAQGGRGRRGPGAAPRRRPGGVSALRGCRLGER